MCRKLGLHGLDEAQGPYCWHLRYRPKQTFRQHRPNATWVLVSQWWAFLKILTPCSDLLKFQVCHWCRLFVRTRGMLLFLIKRRKLSVLQYTDFLISGCQTYDFWDRFSLQGGHLANRASHRLDHLLPWAKSACEAHHCSSCCSNIKPDGCWSCCFSMAPEPTELMLLTSFPSPLPTAGNGGGFRNKGWCRWKQH